MSTQACEIAIVGGGIAGAATALALHAAGFEVRLVERGGVPRAFDAAHYDPRVYAIADGPAGFLEDLGLWQAVAAARAAPILRMRVWAQDPARALNFDAAEAGAASLGWIVEHGLLADALWSALPPGVAMSGREVLAVRLEPGDVQLQLSDGSALKARLAIGAEGADSMLREAAGIATTGWSYAATALVCHLESGEPHRDAALQRFLPSGPVALLPLADGRRSLVWSTTDPDARELLALDDDAFARALEDAVQHAAGTIGRVTRRLAFPLRLMHAQAYVAPGCALLGDSAHLVHPLAGQGLNLGLADARQLAQELGHARDAGRQWWAERTLRRYERARQSANLEMLALTDALGRAFALDLPGWRRVLSLGMRTVDRLAPLKQALAGRAAGAQG